MSSVKSKILSLVLLFALAPALCAMVEPDQTTGRLQGEKVTSHPLDQKKDSEEGGKDQEQPRGDGLPGPEDEKEKTPLRELEQPKEPWYEKPKVLVCGASTLVLGGAYTGYTTCPVVRRKANKAARYIRSKAQGLKSLIKRLQHDQLTRADLARVAVLAGAGYGGHLIASHYELYGKIANLMGTGQKRFAEAYQNCSALIHDHKKATAIVIASSMAALALCKAYSLYTAHKTDYHEAYRQFIRSLRDEDLLAIASNVKGYDKLFEKALSNPALLQDNKQFVEILNDTQKNQLAHVIELYKSTLED